MELKLVVLCCPVCRHAMSGSNGQVLVDCQSCQKIFELESGQLHERSARWFEPSSSASNPDFVPLWCFQTSIDLRDRKTAGGGGVGKFFKSLFGGEQANPNHGELSLFVPAWDLPLRELRQFCPALIRHWAKTQVEQGSPDRLPSMAIPATRTLAQAQQALHFIFLTLEADLDDTLVTLDYDLHIIDAHLTLLPAKLGADLELLI